jgi:hypothetical protein
MRLRVVQSVALESVGRTLEARNGALEMMENR